jgi:hypothetical protein
MAPHGSEGRQGRTEGEEGVHCTFGSAPTPTSPTTAACGRGSRWRCMPHDYGGREDGDWERAEEVQVRKRVGEHLQRRGGGGRWLLQGGELGLGQKEKRLVYILEVRWTSSRPLTGQAAFVPKVRLPSCPSILCHASDRHFASERRPKR